jgi:hypothetical protein
MSAGDDADDNRVRPSQSVREAQVRRKLQGMNLNERRRFQRIAPLLANEKRCLVSIGNRYLKSALVDMSGGGALFYLGNSDPAELGVGSSARLFFESGGTFFDVPAILLRKNGLWLAFRFAALTPSDHREIDIKIVRMKMLSARLSGPDPKDSPVKHCE